MGEEKIKPYYYLHNFSMTRKDMLWNAKNGTLVAMNETYPFHNWQETLINKIKRKLKGTGFYIMPETEEVVLHEGKVRHKVNIGYGKTQIHRNTREDVRAIRRLQRKP